MVLKQKGDHPSRWTAVASIAEKIGRTAQTPNEQAKKAEIDPGKRAGRAPWRSFEAVEFATFEWVYCFNNRRLLEPIRNIPPAEAEEHYCTSLGILPLAA